MTQLTSRRAFLRGAPKGADLPRPPGALPDLGFADACTQCGDCARACPERVIKRDKAGFPVLDFASDGCTFCGKCVEACEAGALAEDEPFVWRAEVAQGCLALNGVECRACQDFCDERAIRFQLKVGGRSTPVIDLETCTGCGFCIAPCPVDALSLTRPQPRPQPQMETHPC